MKNILKITGIAAILASVILFTACNHETKKEETNANLEELKKELEDVGVAIDNLKKSESEFKEQAQLVLDEFNQEMEKFENKLNESGEEIDQQTKQNIDDLKNAEKELQIKLDRLNNQTEENLAELKEEVKHDLSEFGKSVKSFFQDDL